MIRRKSKTEAQQAREHATATLAEVRSRADEVSEIAQDLSDIGERNHFAEAILAAMKLREHTSGDAAA